MDEGEERWPRQEECWHGNRRVRVGVCVCERERVCVGEGVCVYWAQVGEMGERDNLGRINGQELVAHKRKGHQRHQLR